MAGRELPHAMMMMIPEPWENHESMDDEKRAFYEFHSLPDGTVGRPGLDRVHGRQMIGAVLDRNGLRPSRYYVTKDDLVIMASEAGVLPIAPERVAAERPSAAGPHVPGGHRAGPHRRRRGAQEQDTPARSRIASGSTSTMCCSKICRSRRSAPSRIHGTVLQRQQAFGYTFEDLRFILGPMANDGVKPLGSMGTDTPLAVLSNKPQLLYNYFKQLFAQVTNPPIDPHPRGNHHLDGNHGRLARATC